MKGNIYIIVDDEQVNLMILGKYIEIVDSSAIVFACDNAKDALEKYKSCITNKYEVKAVITDLQMPYTSGEELIKEMCSFEREFTGKDLNDLTCRFSIFTANGLYSKPLPCGECDKSCGVNVEHKPLDKEKAKRMMNYE